MKVLYKFNYQYDSKNINCINYEKDYGFIIGNEYLVLGKGLFKNNKNFIKDTVYFLIKVNEKIEWFPEFLFIQESQHTKLPFNWYININRNDVYYYIIGYYELCNIPTHFWGLLSQNKDDIEIFNKRYYELKKWEKKLNYYEKEITIEDILLKIK